MTPTSSVPAGVAVVSDGSGVRVWFAPRMELVRSIRVFFTEFVRQMMGDPEASGRIEIAVQELVENAVKGSSGEQVAVELRLKDTPEATEARLETSNRATRWNIACLRQAVDEASAATSPQHLYLELMKRSAGRGKGSGLGIGRVRAEAEMDVGCEVQDDRVVVAAFGKFDKEIR
jgi:anti-sigma regulatory factor (Ser/Thr protein kinase)